MQTNEIQPNKTVQMLIDILQPNAILVNSV